MKKLISLACFVCLLILIGERQAHACDCVRQSNTAFDELESSDAVFVGKVINIQQVQVPAGGQGGFYYEFKVKLRIQKVLKGVNGKVVQIRTTLGAGGGCGFTFKKNEKYLVYALLHQNALITNTCTRTKLLKHAGQDFKEFKGVEIKTTDEGFKTSFP